MPSGGGLGQTGDELRADGFDGLVEKGPDIAASLFERVEQRDARGAVAADQVVDERLDDFGVGEAQQVAYGRLRDPLGRRGEQLIEHRFGVAHPTGGEPGDQVHRGGLGLASVGGQDPVELALDLGHRQPTHVVTLKARQDRRRERRRLGRGEHEDDEVGRLLDRLQECVPGGARDLVRLIEDIDLAPQLARRVSQSLAQVADVVDAAVARGVDLDQVERRPLADRHARGARVTGVAVLEIRAVDRLGEDAGERGLARPARPDEEDRVADPLGADRVPERLDDGFLPDDLGEGLGTPSPVEGLVRYG